jgi:hypothetical protein
MVSVEGVLAPAPFGWVLLQLHYDGRRPPTALLDDLARLGWTVPAPPSRPASAIDWYTPDPLTGERFTVKPWRAVHDIDPPGRATHRSAWTSEHRTVVLQALAPVLGGHQVQVSSPMPELVALVTAAAPAPGPVGTDPGAGPAIVTFVAPFERFVRIDGFLRSTGLAYWSTTEVRTRKGMFRGSATEVDVKVVVGEVVVRAEQADALGARLRDELAMAKERPATTADLDRVEMARATAAARAEPAPPAPPASPGLRRPSSGDTRS